MRMLFLAVFVSLVVCGTSPTGEEGESGTRYQISETAKEVRQGVELIIRFDNARTAFAGTVKNTTSSAVEQVRVEVHLSNGTELGPYSPGRVEGWRDEGCSSRSPGTVLHLV